MAERPGIALAKYCSAEPIEAGMNVLLVGEIEPSLGASIAAIVDGGPTE